jgi:hypothetical protein
MDKPALPVAQQDERAMFVVDNDKGESIIDAALPVGTQVFTRAALSSKRQDAQGQKDERAFPDWISYDESAHVLTVKGIKYAAEMFYALGGIAPVGESFTVIDRKDGVLTLARLAAPSVPTGGSIDTPELRRLIARAQGWSDNCAVMNSAAVELIAHVATKIQAARDEAVVAASLAAADTEVATMVVRGQTWDDGIQTRENIINAILALRSPAATDAGEQQ